MLVSERLALIGGSILLSSLLIFSVKDRVMKVTPNIIQGISNTYENSGNAFYVGFQEAQKSGEDTGTWGSSKYYIGKDDDLHVGGGRLAGSLYNAIGADHASNIQSLDFDEGVQAPQDSSFLLSTSNRGIMGVTHLQNIKGLSNLDTSQVQSMNNIFSNDADLTSLNLSSWDVHNVRDLSFAFWGNSNLDHLDISGWDTSNADNMHDTFDVTDRLYNLTLGDKTYIKDGNQSGFSNSKHVNASFTSGSQTLTSYQLEDGHSHLGTWVGQ